MVTLSVVIPVFNNQDSLMLLADELANVEKELLSRGMGLQLIFVNDASTDDSLERLRDIQRRRPQTMVIDHFANSGSMAAIKTGFAHVTGDCFTFLVADLQDPPRLLIKMVDAWRNGNRFVVCTRAKREDPPLTKLFAWLNYRLVRLLVSRDFPSGGFDMAIMDRIMLPHMLRCGRNKNLSLFAWSLGIPATILTYHREKRPFGKSMWTFRKKVNYFIDSTVGFSVKPLRVMTIMGLILALGCFLYVAFIFVARLLGIIPVPGYATIVSLIGLMQGCVFVMMGVLGEYIWRIYTEIDQRPEAIAEIISPPGSIETGEKKL
jgi:polyisoprenyl-phosphate glycosyltransferase